MNLQIVGVTTGSVAGPGRILLAQLGKSVFALAALSLPWSLIGAWSSHQLNFTVTPAGLVGGLLFALTFVTLFAAPSALRLTGHPRLAPWAVLAVVIEMVATLMASQLLAHTSLIEFPVFGAIAVAVVLALAALLLSRADEDVERPETGAWWERGSVSSTIFVVFCLLLGRATLSTWPTAWVPRFGTVVALVITMQCAWFLIHGESDGSGGGQDPEERAKTVA